MELLTYAFDSTCTFPFKKCLFRYENREFVIIQGSDTECDNIKTIINDQSERDVVFEIIHKFLYKFGWANGCSFNYRGHYALGLSHPVDLLAYKGNYIVNRIYRNFLVKFNTILPSISSDLEIALSIYNEAKFTKNLFYQFLCFWKILEIPYQTRSLNAVAWVNEIFKREVIKFYDDELLKF